MKKKIKLDKEERELLKSIESGQWRSVKNLDAEIRRARDIAGNTLRKDKRVNIRLSFMDLEGLRKKAFEEGIPYQTLMASVLHKYVSGRLSEKR
ncbi:MAG: antitoxin [Deltaproteobacteria bacterium]|nr:antitoxin [Deltaproteobacteria bacterium]